MLNEIKLIGNVGADPEIRTVGDNVKVARMSVATSKTIKLSNGERKTETQWLNVTLWRGLAGIVENYVKKGQTVFISGEVQYRKYEKEGVTLYATDIIASDMKMIGKNQQTTEASPAEGGNAADDLPF